MPSARNATPIEVQRRGAVSSNPAFGHRRGERTATVARSLPRRQPKAALQYDQLVILAGFGRSPRVESGRFTAGRPPRDALAAAGVPSEAVYEDRASGKRDDRPGLEACLKALRSGDTLVVWKLDRLGRDLAHLVGVVSRLAERKIGLRVLTGQGAAIDTGTASGRLVFGIFAALAEFERELIRERTRAGLVAARARGKNGGRKFALTKAQVRLAMAAMKDRDASVTDLAAELGIKPVTLYRYVSPKGELREHGRRVLEV